VQTTLRTPDARKPIELLAFAGGMNSFLAPMPHAPDAACLDVNNVLFQPSI
jgi:hypothetical protein